MRVLVTAVPAVGHILPVIPLAQAFRAAGHEVLMALAEHTEVGVAAGLPVVDVAPGYDSVEVTSAVLRDDPVFREQVWDVKLTSESTIEPRAPMFAAINGPLLAGTVQLAEQWRPDLVIYEQTASAGPLVAARFGVPAVQQNIASLATGDAHNATAALLRDECERYRIPLPLPKPLATIEVLPPSVLKVPTDGWFMGGLPYEGGGVLGTSLPSKPSRPQVAITLGGGFSHEFFGLDSLQAVIDAAAETELDYVLALGESSVDKLGSLPENVHPLGRWYPYTELFKSCSAVVHHGGGGTIRAAVGAGIAQLVVRMEADAAGVLMGDAVQDRGLGRSISPDEVTSAGLQELIDEPTFQRAAAEVQLEVADLPTPADIVARIVRAI